MKHVRTPHTRTVSDVEPEVDDAFQVQLARESLKLLKVFHVLCHALVISSCTVQPLETDRGRQRERSEQDREQEGGHEERDRWHAS